MTQRLGAGFIERLRDDRNDPAPLLRESMLPLIERALARQLRLRLPSVQPGMDPGEGKHVHMLPEMFFQVGGACEFRFTGETILLKTGELLLIPKGVAHGERTVGREDTFCNFVLMLHDGRSSGHFAVSRNNRPSVCRPCLSMRELSFTVFRDCIDTLLEAGTRSDPVSIALRQGALLNLLGRLARLPEANPPGIRDTKVVQCRQIVRGQLANHAMNVNTLAEWLGCAPSYLSHRFHQETGETLTSFIARLRVEYAEHLMRSTPHSIQEIGWACGFASPAYFARTYRRLRGISPRSFRKKSLAE